MLLILNHEIRYRPINIDNIEILECERQASACVQNDTHHAETMQKFGYYRYIGM